MVHWHECREFLAAMGLVLPTLAQWEYAARAGSSTLFPTGNDPRLLKGYVNAFDAGTQRRDQPDQPGTLPFADGYKVIAPVGLYRPNRFGLHNLMGNVQEWVRDISRAVLQDLDPGDGAASEPFTIAMLKGGSYTSGVAALRSSSISATDIWSRVTELGIRPARRVEPGPAK